MNETRPTHEALVPPAKVRYPITVEQIAQLASGSTISNVPAEKVVDQLFQPVFEDDLAGDLAVQKARKELTAGEQLDLAIERVNPAEQTILVSLTFPGNSEVWNGKNKHQVELNYNFFTNESLKEKAGRALRNLFKSEPTASQSQ